MLRFTYSLCCSAVSSDLLRGPRPGIKALLASPELVCDLGALSFPNAELQWSVIAGTLKDDQHCYLCGQNGHRQFECPNQPQEVYRLPTALQEKVEAQYERDVNRMAGPGAETGLVMSARVPFIQSLWSPLPERLFLALTIVIRAFMPFMLLP